MLTFHRFRVAWLSGLVVLLLAGLALAACGGAATPLEAAPVPAEVEEGDSTPTTAPQETAEEPEALAATDTPAATAEVAQETSTVAQCEAIDIPDNEFVADVSDTDWVKGPANASITLIEYSDFQ